MGIGISGGYRPYTKGGPGVNLLALLAFLPSVISSSFLCKIRRGVGGPLGPSPRSATGYWNCNMVP